MGMVISIGWGTGALLLSRVKNAIGSGEIGSGEVLPL
jgi:hypothetical protein